jgi:hypothetical protein
MITSQQITFNYVPNILISIKCKHYMEGKSQNFFEMLSLKKKNCRLSTSPLSNYCLDDNFLSKINFNLKHQKFMLFPK